MTSHPNIPAQRSRPSMPDYGISSKDEGLMNWEWVDGQMTKSRNYWICSTKPDGNPHAAPVWGVWLEGELYFGSAKSSRKARNFEHNSEIVVHLESGDDTVILEGKVSVVPVDSKPLLVRVVEAYTAKYPPFAPDAEDANNPFFAFKPQTALAWLESDFPNTATRWTFEDKTSK